MLQSQSCTVVLQGLACRGYIRYWSSLVSAMWDYQWQNWHWATWNLRMVTALQLLHQLILHSFLCVPALIFCRFSNHTLACCSHSNLWVLYCQIQMIEQVDFEYLSYPLRVLDAYRSTLTFRLSTIVQLMHILYYQLQISDCIEQLLVPFPVRITCIHFLAMDDPPMQSGHTL